MKKKIVFLPAGLGLAHTGRCVMLAKELKKRGFDIFFGVGEHAKIVLEKENFPFKILPEGSFETYEKKIRRLNPSIFTFRMIKDFVKAEISLFEKETPSLVVADSRPTAFVSTKIAQIPLVSITGTQVTPFYDFKETKIRFPSYWSRFLPKRLIKLLEKKQGENFLKKIVPPLFKLLTAEQLFKFNLVLLKFKKQPVTSFLDFFLGDLTLLLDPPFFRPVKPLPDNVKIVGPIFWQGVGRLSSWVEKIEKAKITIYLTAGGTGDKKIFEKCLEFLSETSYQIIATIGNTAKLSEVKVVKRKEIFLTDFLPGEWAMKKADLVIFPGGNSTCYQALYNGCPQIGIPVNIDQEDNLSQLLKLGTVITIDPFKELDREMLLKSIGKILTDKKYRENTKKLQKKLLKYNGKKTAADLIEKFLAREGVYR